MLLQLYILIFFQLAKAGKMKWDSNISKVAAFQVYFCQDVLHIIWINTLKTCMMWKKQIVEEYRWWDDLQETSDDRHEGDLGQSTPSPSTLPPLAQTNLVGIFD